LHLDPFDRASKINQPLALTKIVIITFLQEIGVRTLGVISAGEEANIASDSIK
jgi:hypothetical protein